MLQTQVDKPQALATKLLVPSFKFVDIVGMDEEVIGLNTHVMTVLAQHSVLAQHLEGAVLTQHRFGKGVLVQHISGSFCSSL